MLLRWPRLDRAQQGPAPTFWLTRALFLRGLGAIYLVAFASLVSQLRPLLGAEGILPVVDYLAALRAQAGGAAILASPTIFWLSASDGFLSATAWLGLAGAVVVLAGRANALVMAALWVLYLSFVHVGQVFYGYGWEILLLETGFLAIFLCPLLRPADLAVQTPPPVIVLFLLRWLAFRLMFGAGLIKLRGDTCWRDLTCLIYHYETQPLPNPISWVLHQTPPWFHRLETLWNYFIEVVVPFALFGPRPARTIAGLLTIAFQTTLIISGNLSWLNYLTIVICLACFDDRTLSRVIPARVRQRFAEVAAAATAAARSPAQRPVVIALAVVVGVLSIQPAINLLSPEQAMNASFDRLHLVNTYGAFGSVGRVRHEVILSGTWDDPGSADAHWREYELPCKPGDVHRRPCVIAPFQLRLDWQIWFAAMSTVDRQPWLVHLIAQLLEGKRGALSLLAGDPFGGRPPRAIRAELYEYHFTRFGDGAGAWWRRERVAEYLRPLTLADPALRKFLQARGWTDD
jgi:hypothetical protein